MWDRLIRRGEVIGRSLFMVELDDLADWPEDAQLPSIFALALVVDAGDFSDAPIRGFARKVMRQGASEIVAIGPGSDRVHRLFDEVRREELPRDACTSADDDLESGLRYAVWEAGPHPEYEDEWYENPNVIAVLVGQPELRGLVEERLSNPDSSPDDV